MSDLPPKFAIALHTLAMERHVLNEPKTLTVQVEEIGMFGERLETENLAFNPVRAGGKLRIDWSREVEVAPGGRAWAALHATISDDSAPGALRFERGPSGKPSVAGEPQLRFNLSHAGDWAALAWLVHPAPTPAVDLGVDLECAQSLRNLVRLATRCFGEAEGALVAALPAPEAAARFRDRWTLAEAWVKARGGSLARVLGSPALPQPPVDARAGSRPAAEGQVPASWQLLTPAPELTLALWLEGAGSLRPRLSRGLPLRPWRPLPA